MMDSETSSGHTNGQPKTPVPNSPISSDGYGSIGSRSLEWKAWPDVTLKLDGLLADTQLSQIWEWLHDEGTIVWMDFLSNQSRESRTIQRRPLLSANVRFEPPPKRNFWATGRYFNNLVSREQYPNGLQVSLLPQKGERGHWQISTQDPNEIIPSQIKLRPLSLEFGVLLGRDRMKSMRTVRPFDGHGIELELSLQHRSLTCYFPVPARHGNWRGVRNFKFRVDISQIQIVHFTSSENDSSCYLVVPLAIPPQYYWKNTNTKSTIEHDQQHWSHLDTWNRATDVVEDFEAPMRFPIALNDRVEDPQYTEIGRWTTFRFHLDQSARVNKKLVQQLWLGLGQIGISCRSSPQFEVAPPSKAAIWTLLDQPLATEKNGGALALLESSSRLIHLEFPVRYQLEVCISRGVLNEHAIHEKFLQKLAAMDPTRARLRLEYLVDQNEALQDPMSLFNNPDAEAYLPNLRLPHYCALIRKVIITPTSVRFSTPNAETSNRVIRKYNLLQDRFLRVQFLEESEKFRIGAFKAQNDSLYVRLLRVMYQGIQIGDRQYEFLAFGSSQLRECSAYFFCSTETTTCDDIRKWMGEFSHIKVVAKYAARLGQCFSTTREIRGIHAPHTRLIPDIEKNGYCFTDGVGIISGFLARLIVEELDLDVFADPTTFQFRMGGCKGVLTVWPEAKGMEVCIRESQQKFLAEIKGLEIIKCAKLATATLNRQTITILECLGVRPSAFHDLLDHQLRRFEMAMRDRNVAIELLTQFVDENQVTLTIAELLKADFISNTRSEPFVTSILNLWKKWSLKLLKEKARIHVSQSAFVLGCVDETGSLRGHYVSTEGSVKKDINKLPQIFLQLSDPKIYNKTKIVEGICIVGRNPSLHPGDIRVVQAVDEPKLHHLKDVVVFPSTGDRPVPNMLSGGDLDGDDFFIMWDPSLIPPQWNHPPMDYTGSKPTELDRDVTVDDLREFFVSYVKSDVLALVAVSHLGLADELGPKSKMCIQLSEMHSKAVDFPKTGEPVIWNIRNQPRRWPHFMEKKKTYHSKKVLGQIFDKVGRNWTDFRPDWEDDFDQRILTKFNLDNDILKAARTIKTQYDTSVRRILTQYNVNTEFELWTGFAMSKPAIGTDYKRQEVLGQEYGSLKQRFREICYEEAGGRNSDKLDPFVTAMYKVTEEQIKIALYEHNQGPMDEGGHIREARKLEAKSMPLITFPWLFPCAMIRIAQGGRYNVKSSVLAPAGGRNQSQLNKTAPVNGDRAGEPVEANDDRATAVPEGPIRKPVDQRLSWATEQIVNGVRELGNSTERQPLSDTSNTGLHKPAVAVGYVSISKGDDPYGGSGDNLLSAGEEAAEATTSAHCLPTKTQSQTPPIASDKKQDAAIKTVRTGEADGVAGDAAKVQNTSDEVLEQVPDTKKNGRVTNTTDPEEENAGSLVDRLMALGSDE